jgi:hypothetical protein
MVDAVQELAQRMLADYDARTPGQFIRNGEKTTKVYIGSGPLAEMAALLDELVFVSPKLAGNVPHRCGNS